MVIETFLQFSSFRVVPEPEAEVDRETLTDTLFRCIGECGNEDEVEGLREQVVSINMGVADSLARRYFGHGETSEDLRQVAYLGLIKSVAGFDPGRGGNFLSYAVPTITGELKKHFRDRCWAVRPPRRVQDLQREITAVRDTISQESHRQPTIEELAAQLGVPKGHIIEAMTAKGCFSPSSLDARLQSDTGTTFADLLPAADRELARSEAQMMITPLLTALTDNERKILQLRFFEEWTQQQIAQQFGTSQMQISRHLARLLRQLRKQLEPTSDCA